MIVKLGGGSLVLWGFRDFLPTCFYGKVVGKRRREKEGGNGGGDVVEWREEKKLKSAYGKNEFCDHINDRLRGRTPPIVQQDGTGTAVRTPGGFAAIINENKAGRYKE